MKRSQAQALVTALFEEMAFDPIKTIGLDDDKLVETLCSFEDDLIEALLTFYNDYEGVIEVFAQNPQERECTDKKALEAWTEGKPLLVVDGPAPALDEKLLPFMKESQFDELPAIEDHPF